MNADGPQVDDENSPGDNTTETDYINPNGSPMGSQPPGHSGVTHPHKPGDP